MILGSIMVVGVLTRCALLHSVCDLKAAQMNVWRSLIPEVILNEFKLGHNPAKATKNNRWAKGKSAVDHSTVTKCLKKFHVGCKNFDDINNYNNMCQEKKEEEDSSALKRTCTASIRRIEVSKKS